MYCRVVLAENAEGAEKEFCVFIFMRMTDLNTAALYIFYDGTLIF